MRTAPALALAALLALAGCSASGATAESADGGEAGYAVEEGTAADEATGGAGGGAEAPAADGVDLTASPRQVVTEGSVTLTVEDPRGAARDVALVAERVGGHVEERVEQAGSGEDALDASASVVVRVPAAEVTGVLERLEELGEVVSVRMSTTDVTGQAQDLDARVRGLQISIGRLEAMLAEARTTSDLVSAEQTLTDRQVELERLQSQRASLADRVEMSTLRVELWTAEAAPETAPERTGFLGGLQSGWDALLTTLGAALLVLGVLLPWALFAGVVLLAALALRSRMRRSATTASSAAPDGPAGPAGEPREPVGAGGPSGPAGTGR
ncbi:DUF4349 domain-containing protein [Cellulomonas carbonis]|nr:DUF4349 domain-containing protein [Cellulomonas carbonis]GGB98791.1 hypothetical protein GCM10010972_09510 [Cellulomonas carbonis]